MATADQMQREREAQQRARAAQTRANAPAWGAAREARTTSGQGSGRVGTTTSSPNTTRRDKTWDEMNDSERKAALDKVDWDALARMGGATTSNTPTDSGGGRNREDRTNTAAISNLYRDALKALEDEYSRGYENVLGSIGRMEADPYNTANAYAALQAIAPTVAANPIADYAAATGLSANQAAAQTALANAQSEQYQRAAQNMLDVMRTSQEAANASRMADIGLIRTGAQQDLEANKQMLRLALEKSRIGDISGIQQRNLENEMNLRNNLTNQITSILSGQNVAPESILKLIESTWNKINSNRWAGGY